MNRLRLVPIPALNDNYIWLLADADGHALIVDPGEAAPVRAVLARERLQLRAILLTHHHPDHIAGVAELCEAGSVQVFAPHDERINTATHRVVDGDPVEIAALACRFSVIAVPGHTRSHVAYYGEDLLFCGDTLFSVGCGRLFEGTPTQMLASLDRLAALPAQTRICCGHEYTVANCRFALSVDTDNPALTQRFEHARALREEGRPTVPSLLCDEMACNPFLRVDAVEIVRSLREQTGANSSRVERFAALRALKDAFR